MLGNGIDRLVIAVAALLAALALCARPAAAAEALPKLGAELAATSVSGLSSGAYMAGQAGRAFESNYRSWHRGRRPVRLCRERSKRDLSVLADSGRAERCASPL
jgi:hypothetical protein